MPEATSTLLTPKHFDGKQYFNPAHPQARGVLDVMRWKLKTRPELSPAFVADVEPSIPPARVTDGSLRTTLINHSTVLLQQSTLNILTDPIWSLRASPLSWIGPKRRRSPGVRQQDLPPIDVVLISHNHYDHLDLPTLRWLCSLKATHFVVPKGVARLLRSERIGFLSELDWGESFTFAGTTMHCVPAMHFSARGPFDRNRSLWCGYVIEAQNRVIYFAGDTGFGPHFSWIRERFGPPNLSLLPIGAYEPRWFMGPIHMAPDEAVKAHNLLESRTSIATHHGTFQLADDGLDRAGEQLSRAGRQESFLILGNGESVQLP